MRVPYFQKYVTKENVVTSNTMLLLSRLYEYNSNKFFAMLNEGLLKGDNSPELTIILQERKTGTKSLPDAIIGQKSFKIVVETKLNNQFYEEQLTNHLEQFGNEEIKVLLTIDPKPMKKDLKELIDKKIEEINEKQFKGKSAIIKHVNLTFQNLIDMVESAISETDYDFKIILEDYKDFCLYEDLLFEKDNWMKVRLSGQTLEDNCKFSLYYDVAEHGYREHGYIGLYNEKTIKYVGKVKKIVRAMLKDGKLDYEVVSGDKVTDEELLNIRNAMEKSKEYSYNIGERWHNYFIVDKFAETNFIKATKYPLYGSKLFNLSKVKEEIGELNTQKLADYLKDKTWDILENED